MNKEQYKEYRRTQRICYNYDGDPTWPSNEYFNRIPFERKGCYYADKFNLVEAWERAKREYEWQQRSGTTESWQQDMVLVGHNNPRAKESLRAIIKGRMRYV